MKMKWILTAFTAVMLAAPGAMAGESTHEPGEHRGKMMEKIDTDGDGKVSKAEFTASHEERFTKTDTDQDGFLSSEEMKAAWEQMHEKRKAHRAEKAGEAVTGEAPAEAPAEAAE